MAKEKESFYLEALAFCQILTQITSTLMSAERTSTYTSCASPVFFKVFDMFLSILPLKRSFYHLGLSCLNLSVYIFPLFKFYMITVLEIQLFPSEIT